jgi:hypothetical protein
VSWSEDDTYDIYEFWVMVGWDVIHFAYYYRKLFILREVRRAKHAYGSFELDERMTS